MTNPPHSQDTRDDAGRQLLDAVRRYDSWALRLVRQQCSELGNECDAGVVAFMTLRRCRQIVAWVNEQPDTLDAARGDSTEETSDWWAPIPHPRPLHRDQFLRPPASGRYAHPDRDDDQVLVSHDIWTGQTPHFLVTGKPGSGKTSLLHDLLADTLLEEDAQAVVIERGRCYESLVTLLGDDGQQISDEALRLNPCVGTEEEVAAFLPAFLSCFASSHQVPLSPPGVRALRCAVHEAFGKPGGVGPGESSEVTLGAVVACLDLTTEPGREVQERLQPFHGDGAWARYFDGPSTVDLGTKRLTAVAVEGSPSDVSVALVCCLLQAMALYVLNPPTWRHRKVLVLDDSALFLDHPTVRGQIAQLQRIGRRVKLAIGCAMNRQGDLRGSEPGGGQLEAFFHHRFMLTPDAADLVTIPEAPSGLDGMASMLTSVTTDHGRSSEFLYYRTGETDLHVLRLEHDPWFRWIAAVSAHEVALRRAAELHFRLHGLTPRLALIRAIEECLTTDHRSA